MNKIRIALIALFVIQLAVPLSMIWQKEQILAKGEVVKFQVRPVDPYDAFRGKYLSIGLVDNEIYTAGDDYSEGQTVYVLLNKEMDGFVTLWDISVEPFHGELYMKCTVDDAYEDYVLIDPPFNRYYLNEDYSQMGEDLYNRFSSGDREDAYVTVRISRGRAVLEEMYLAGVEINRLIEEELEKEEN